MITKVFLRNYMALWSLGTVLAACGGSTGEEQVIDYSNCRYEKPEAIFYDGLPQISRHHFEERGRGSEESFTLSGGVGVTIFQYGCDYRTQEFHFELPGASPCDAPPACGREIARLLQTLSRLGPEYHIFRAWGQAIAEVSPQLAFGESTQLAEGFRVKIDQRSSGGNAILMLTLSEKP